MDRNYIEREHIVDRYLAGELTVREAREFEKYCLEHPQFLNSLPIPVRLKARLSRRPLEDSETGIFPAIPSSTTHAALRAAEEGLDLDDAEDDDEEPARPLAQILGGANRFLVFGLIFALIAAIAGIIAYAVHAGGLADELERMKRQTQAVQMRAPGSVQTYRLQLSRAKPSSPTISIGWPNPPQLMDIHVDVTEGRYNTFQITIDKADGTRVMQIRRIARDSNKELRFALNSSAFGPGNYLLRFDGYNWRGQTEEIGWVMLGLQ
ncbi:MAG TPA: hypothetical protein VIL28_13125 [Steroidobacteraceae bacterium]